MERLGNSPGWVSEVMVVIPLRKTEETNDFF
jgi:hypothetical protein